MPNAYRSNLLDARKVLRSPPFEDAAPELERSGAGIVVYGNQASVVETSCSFLARSKRKGI